MESLTILKSWLINTVSLKNQNRQSPLWLFIIKELIIDDTFAEDVKQLDSLLHM